MFLFRAHNFVCGRLAHGFGHGRAGNAVLSGRDPVRNALARHLQRVEANEGGEISDFSKNTDHTDMSSSVLPVPGRCPGL